MNSDDSLCMQLALACFGGFCGRGDEPAPPTITESKQRRAPGWDRSAAVGNLEGYLSHQDEHFANQPYNQETWTRNKAKINCYNQEQLQNSNRMIIISGTWDLSPGNGLTPMRETKARMLE